VNLSQTWNTSGTPTAILCNITDTASSAASLLMDLQVGGAGRFQVQKNGYIVSRSAGYSPTIGFAFCVNGSNTSNQNLVFTNQGGLIVQVGLSAGFNAPIYLYNFSVGGFVSTTTIGFSSNAGVSGDLLLARDAANTLAQRNGVNTQTSRLYKLFTDASNYTRSAWQFDANGVQIAGESAGAGGDANISITLTPKGTGSIRTTGKIYPATDALAAQTAAGIFAGTGAPSDANGDNGDFYLRSDGGLLTTIYQKRAGAWVGIV
jgi:hypothetical protein